MESESLIFTGLEIPRDYKCINGGKIMMGLKGKLGTALLSASMLGMLIGTPVQAASSVSGKINSSTCSGSVS